MSIQELSTTYPSSMQDFEKNLEMVMKSKFGEKVNNFCLDMFYSILGEGNMADDYVEKHNLPFSPSDAGWVEINEPIDGEHYAIQIGFKITKIKKFTNAEYNKVMEEFKAEPKSPKVDVLH